MCQDKPEYRAVALKVVALLVGTAVTAACGEAAVGGSAATVYEGARLIDGQGGPPIEDALLVVENDRIAQLGGRGDVQVPSDAGRVDLTGKTVIPAIINAHVHLAQTREERLAQLEHMAYYGTAAALSLGQDVGDVAFTMRDEALPGAARSRTAGRGITTPEPGRTDAPYWVTTEAEARTAVRELAARRVDLVKIWVDDRDGQYEKLSPGLYGAVIDEAHSHGLRVIAHIFTLEDAKGLLRAGVDAFAHGIRDREIDDELVSLWRERPEVVLVPNLPDPGVAADLGWLSGTVPADELREMQEGSIDRPAARQAFGIQARNLARLSEAGIAIAFGTDGSTPWAAHLEMEDMVRSGMSPADVIVAATSASATLVGLSDVGAIAPGMSADFVILDANPLDDITNTRRISDVYLRGAALDRAALSARLTRPAS